ncbi:hypothetical protein [Halothiobacillus sp. DCM-1]|uniref:hypothetical protein n=1 Tax=Halothiobacillus sp. DCM-1 TaxID=3112558 RepID=UPI0032505B06
MWRFDGQWWHGDRRILLLLLGGALLSGCASESWQGAAYESLKTRESMSHPSIGTPSPNPPPSMNYPAYDSQRQRLLQGAQSPE